MRRHDNRDIGASRVDAGGGLNFIGKPQERGITKRANSSVAISSNVNKAINSLVKIKYALDIDRIMHLLLRQFRGERRKMRLRGARI